ncbi:MAG: hypothetical protein MH252_17140 [Thermosynechococcaceae cyanobacterium MS004]|nr:hypothetical protein [Thermosynechococcaceae cyanobacterium MS004]
MRKAFIALLTITVASGGGQLPLVAQPLNSGPINSAPNNSVPNRPAPSSDVYFLNRAKNLARQAAINANGGLERYRPDATMYGPAVQTAYVRNSDGSITFQFTGTTPGASIPSFETVARVNPNGVVSLEYNGAPRSAIGGASLPAPSILPPVPIAVPEPSAPPTVLPLVPSDGPLPTAGAITPRSVPAEGTIGASRTAIAWVDQDAFLSRAQNLARQAAIRANGGLATYRPEPTMFGPSAQAPFRRNPDGSLTFSFKGGAPGASILTLESTVVVSPSGSVEIQYNGPIR